MDELLESRVKQLREIDERLERIQREAIAVRMDKIHKALRELRNDLADMIRVAQSSPNSRIST